MVMLCTIWNNLHYVQGFSIFNQLLPGFEQIQGYSGPSWSKPMIYIVFLPGITHVNSTTDHAFVPKHPALTTSMI